MPDAAHDPVSHAKAYPAINLRGITNLCEDLALRPDDVARWLMELAENQEPFCRAVVAAGRSG